MRVPKGAKTATLADMSQVSAKLSLYPAADRRLPEQYHPEYPLVIADGSPHVEAVARALCTFGREARMSIDETNALGGCRGDFGKKVGCIGVKWLWFVEARIPGRQVIRTNN